MHEGLVRFPAVARIVESLQGGSSIAVAAVSKDRLNDELLLIVLNWVLRNTWVILDKRVAVRLMLMGLCYLEKGVLLSNPVIHCAG